LRALKDTMPLKVFNEVRATYLKNLIQHGDSGISYKRTINKLEKNARFLAEMFDDSPEVLKEVSELLEVGKRSGDAIMNFSGTERSRVFRDFASKIFNIGVSEATLETGKKVARKSKAMKGLAKVVKPKKVKAPKSIGLSTKTGLTRGLGKIIATKDDGNE